LVDFSWKQVVSILPGLPKQPKRAENGDFVNPEGNAFVKVAMLALQLLQLLNSNVADSVLDHPF
jgi:hypothetical protein